MNKLIKIHCSTEKYGACTSCNLYRSKICTCCNLYKSTCTSCNLYKQFVQVATCTDFLHKLQLLPNLNLYITPRGLMSQPCFAFVTTCLLWDGEAIVCLSIPLTLRQSVPCWISPHYHGKCAHPQSQLSLQ